MTVTLPVEAAQQKMLLRETKEIAFIADTQNLVLLLLALLLLFQMFKMKLLTVSSREIFRRAKSTKFCNSHQQSVCVRIWIALHRVTKKDQTTFWALISGLLQLGVKVRMTQMKFCAKDEDHSYRLFSSWLEEELHILSMKAHCRLSD